MIIILCIIEFITIMLFHIPMKIRINEKLSCLHFKADNNYTCLLYTYLYIYIHIHTIYWYLFKGSYSGNWFSKRRSIVWTMSMSFCQRSSSWLNEANKDSLTQITIWGCIRFRTKMNLMQIWHEVFDLSILNLFLKAHKDESPYIDTVTILQYLLLNGMFIDHVNLYLTFYQDFFCILLHITLLIYKLHKIIRICKYIRNYSYRQ